jgi:hypothetical protein
MSKDIAFVMAVAVVDRRTVYDSHAYTSSNSTVRHLYCKSDKDEHLLHCASIPNDFSRINRISMDGNRGEPVPRLP